MPGETVAMGLVPLPTRRSYWVFRALPVPPLPAPKIPEVISEAGREGVLLEAAVIRPWASTVKEGIWVVEPKEPTLELATFKPKTPLCEIVASPLMDWKAGAAPVWPKKSWPLEPTVVVEMGLEPLPIKTAYWVFRALPVPPWETPAMPVEVRFLLLSVKTREEAVRVAMLILPRAVTLNREELVEEETLKGLVVPEP